MNTATMSYREEQLRSEGSSREARILQYLPLVQRVASRLARHLPASVDRRDLVLAGCVGLIAALERFDPQRGLDFGTFAEFRIRGAILDELRALDPISRRARRRLHQVEARRRALTGQLGRPPDNEELAQDLGMSLAEFERQQAVLTPGLELSLSLLEQCGFELPSDPEREQAQPDQRLLRNEARRRLTRALRRLPERLRTVVSLYYYAQLSYKEIALLFDVTESRVCQMHREAVNIMRDVMLQEGPAPEDSHDQR
ncbi:MAG: FliA/WhiG family RNA polymerase sigma factor [Myxococcales bacterium]|nr:FliA/WhiG family RNA polymerase sigma factor [Myxococcales bacterium]